MQVADGQRLMGMDFVQADGRHAGIAILGKAVGQHLQQSFAGNGVGIDIDFAELAIRAYVVHASHVVVMGMGNEYAVDASERLWQNLLAEVGSAVYEQPRGVGLDKCRAAQPLVAWVGALAHLALAADGRHAARCPRSKKSQSHLQALKHQTILTSGCRSMPNVSLTSC